MWFELNILVEMKVDLTNQLFERIRIENTSLIRGNFVRCNLNESEFNNVDISGMNLNGALLQNCKWKNIKIQELNKLNGHTGSVLSISLSPDGTTLASGSSDKSIRLWDVKSGLQIQDSDQKYQDLLAQFKLPLHQNNLLGESTSYLNILLISQLELFQAKGALILQGEFVNHQGYDLKQLLKQKGNEFQKPN
ncbi:unnamed protein product [Paramecium sonneborni]|uniref:Uncharacterized protein n=1 Tax=Paramecium sonneborni TaxID=65129 RepID=A0A8S1RQM0_9CILI|nr:unnamed protein product [Paramecium sonneborni]